VVFNLPEKPRITAVLAISGFGFHSARLLENAPVATPQPQKAVNLLTAYRGVQKNRGRVHFFGKGGAF